jgi:hypothetical protein
VDGASFIRSILGLLSSILNPRPDVNLAYSESISPKINSWRDWRLPVPPVTITILAIMLLAIYITVGPVQHLIEAPAFLPIQPAVVQSWATFIGFDSALLINESVGFTPRELSAANAISNPIPLGIFTSIDIVVTAASVALGQTNYRKYPGDHHRGDKKSKQGSLHNVISSCSSLNVTFRVNPLENLSFSVFSLL